MPPDPEPTAITLDESEQPAPEKAAIPPEFVPKAAHDELVGHVAALSKRLEDAGSKLQILDKVATILQGKPESTLTKEEQLVVQELRRLMPHVLPNTDLLSKAPELFKTVGEASKLVSDNLVNAAFGYQLELQQAAGLKVEDPKFNYYIGSAVKDWINQDQDRRARFWRGDRGVVKEGFDEVKATLVDPLRVADKRAAVSTHVSRPRNVAPAGSAGAGEGPKAVDFSDRKSVREALRAAFAS